MPETNRHLILKSRPDGIPGPRHFDLDEVDVAEPNPGEVPIRNVYPSVDPAHRSIRPIGRSGAARLGQRGRQLFEAGWNRRLFRQCRRRDLGRGHGSDQRRRPHRGPAGTAAVLAGLYEGRNTSKALFRIRPDPTVQEGPLRPASRTSR
jgi:hypothetical protein